MIEVIFSTRINEVDVVASCMRILRTRTNRAINHRGKNSANSLEKHARFSYNDMQMYLTTIPHDPVVVQTNRIRRVLARVNVKFHNCRNVIDDRPRNSFRMR